MTNGNNSQNLVEELMPVLLRLPWTDVLNDALKALREAIQGRSDRSFYEVLEHGPTFELSDRERMRAIFGKREKARYL